ncbi:unnamed protein product, partial [Staurois parvus]
SIRSSHKVHETPPSQHLPHSHSNAQQAQEKDKERSDSGSEEECHAIEARFEKYLYSFGQSRGQNQSVEPQCGGGSRSNGRPYSTLWQSVAMETAAMGGRTGTHDTLWTWQQHEEAVQGPMAEWRSVSSLN